MWRTEPRTTVSCSVEQLSGPITQKFWHTATVLQSELRVICSCRALETSGKFKKLPMDLSAAGREIYRRKPNEMSMHGNRFVDHLSDGWVQQPSANVLSCPVWDRR